MTQATDTDIRELKDLIIGLDKKIDVGFTKMEGELKNIDTRLKLLEANAQKLPDLAEKVGELKNWKQIAIIFFTTVVSGTIGYFIRGGQVR
jgi:hypothetical protein